MENKTIKELSIELTVETTAVCDTIKGRSVFVNSCCVLVLLLVRILMKRNTPKVMRIS